MDITGRLIQILPEATGESQRGTWVRGGFVIETENEFPRKVAFTAFGEDRVAMIKQLQMNSSVTVTFSPESREYNGRWYTDLRCVRVVPMGANTYVQQPVQSVAPVGSAQPVSQQMPSGNDAVPFAQGGDEDLPF